MRYSYYALELMFSSVMSKSLWPHGPQHARSPFPSPTLGADPNSCPSSQWCHPTVSSSVPISFSCLQSFDLHQGLFKWVSSSHQVATSIGVSASASDLPINIQGWFPLGLTGLISVLSKRLSRVFFSTTIWKHQFFSAQLSLWFNSHIWKNHSFDYLDLCWQNDVFF